MVVKSLPFNQRAGWYAFALHSVFVISSAVFVYLEIQKSHYESTAIWHLWMALDFPVSIVAIPISVATSGLVDEIGFGLYYVFGYGSYFLVFGGLQYYLVVGLWWGRSTRKRRKKP